MLSWLLEKNFKQRERHMQGNYKAGYDIFSRRKRNREGGSWMPDGPTRKFWNFHNSQKLMGNHRLKFLVLEYWEEVLIFKQNICCKFWVESKNMEKSAMRNCMYVEEIPQKCSKPAVTSQQIFDWVCHKYTERYSIRMDLGL